MIIDSSAIIAILNQEPGHERLERALATTESPKIGAPTEVETGMVLVARFGIRGKTLLAEFLRQRKIEVVEFGAEHAEMAISAFHRYGRGRHPAKLNMGDCYSYATAILAEEPLLFIGEDFPLTDLDLVDLDLVDVQAAE